MCYMLVGEGGSGVVLQILMLPNFINIAKRQSFSAASQAGNVQTTCHGNSKK